MMAAAAASSCYSITAKLQQLPPPPGGLGALVSPSSSTPPCWKKHRNVRCRPSLKIRCLSRSNPDSNSDCVGSGVLLLKRRRRDHIIGGGLVLLGLTTFPLLADAQAAGLPPEDKPKLCDVQCEKLLEDVPMVTTESGLQYKDIILGAGPNPPVGYQVAANYVAMVPSGQIFDSSLEKGLPYIFRVGSGQVIKGLDEGILSMKIGGKRRLYIPGSLAFPKGLNSAPGRPRVAPFSPVVFDVSLEYIPGLEADDEE